MFQQKPERPHFGRLCGTSCIKMVKSICRPKEKNTKVPVRLCWHGIIYRVAQKS